MTKYQASKSGKISLLATRLLSLKDTVSTDDVNSYSGNEPIDEARRNQMAELQAQLDKGNYHINIERLAEKLLRLLGF